MDVKLKKVLVLNPYLPTLGGGEKHMGFLCQFMEEYFENVQIDILVHNYNEIDIHALHYPTVEDLNTRFGLKLQQTQIIKVDLEKSDGMIQSLKNKKKIEKITKQYDLFVNFMFLSKHIGRATFNIYECMFPPKQVKQELTHSLKHLIWRIFDALFYRSYQLFISNSLYTNHWLATFWKSSPKNKTIYPPTFWAEEIKDRYQVVSKKNIIISVGRFFVAAHSKKQLEMVKIFINNRETLGSYEYHLVGAISNAPQDLAYLNAIKSLAASVDNVFIHENCPYGQLMELYKQAKIFWHATGYLVDENREPEKMEHFGITTVEAMSFGAVPVVINKGGQKETVIHGETGYLWNDEMECVELTKNLIDDDAMRKKFAVAAVERSYQFSIDTFYKENRRMFHECQL